MTTNPPGYFERLLDELKTRELPIPAVLCGKESMPLALSTRADLPAWAASHGYDADALAVLERLVAATVHSTRYQKALAADLSMRFTLDGAPTESVSQQDRLSTALNLHTRALKTAALEPKKIETPPPTKSPELAEQAPARRPLIRLGTLSPQELERRRAALAGAPR
jgi:hypothetical protein